MEEFFNTIYYYTNNFYSVEMDNYLYETVPGYLHNGFALLVFSVITCLAFYYWKSPVRRQMLWWLCFVGINAALNFIFGLWYTMTPLINNEIDADAEWSYLDCFSFSFTSILWSVVFFVAISLLFKWWSPAKYVPFRKF